MTTLVSVVGDLHVNSTVALCPPDAEIDDNVGIRISKVQRWIWGNWQRYWEAVAAERDRAGAELVVVLNGELADDNHHVTYQLLTKNPLHQMDNAVKALQPMLDILKDKDRIYVTRGTEAHSGPSAWMDEKIAADIGAVGDPATGWSLSPRRKPPHGASSWWQLETVWDGVRCLAAHHPPGGGGKDPEARARWAIAQAGRFVKMRTDADLPIPRLVFWGHVHNPADSGNAYRKCRVIVHPAWQLKTVYGYRIGGDPLPIGGGWALVDRGRIEKVETCYHEIRIR